MCETIVITTTEQAEAFMRILDKEAAHARANDYAAEKAKRIRNMRCCCCGGCYRGRQWWNQDCGYGLGDCCATKRFGIKPGDGESSCYGVPGIHFLIDEPVSE